MNFKNIVNVIIWKCSQMYNYLIHFDSIAKMLI